MPSRWSWNDGCLPPSGYRECSPAPDLASSELARVGLVLMISANCHQALLWRPVLLGRTGRIAQCRLGGAEAHIGESGRGAAKGHVGRKADCQSESRRRDDQEGEWGDEGYRGGVSRFGEWFTNVFAGVKWKQGIAS